MRLDEAGDDLTYRTSELTTYLRCPRQLGYRRVLGLKIQPSATMLGGTSIDDTLTEHHTQRIRGVNGLRGSALTDFFVAKLRENTGKALETGPLAGEPDPDVERDGVKVLPVYERDYDPICTPVSVQKEVSKSYPAEIDQPGYLEKAEVRLVGHIDLKRKTAVSTITADHKFTTKSPSQMNAAVSLQLQSYDELDGDDTHAVELVLLRRLKEPKVETTQSFVTKEQRSAVVQTLKNAWWAVSRRFFPMTEPSNWWCSKSWCGYYQICRGREGGPLPIPGEVNPPTP